MKAYKSEYAQKLRDPRWQKKRLQVMERDNFKCRDCSDASKNLHVHHCLYEKGDPWDTDSRFLLTLCDECHERRQSLESDAKRALGFLMAESSSDQLEILTTSIVASVGSNWPNKAHSS